MKPQQADDQAYADDDYLEPPGIEDEGHAIEPEPAPEPAPKPRRGRPRKPVPVHITENWREPHVAPAAPTEFSATDMHVLGVMALAAIRAGVTLAEYAERVREEADVWARVQADTARNSG
jgi:hypothetical protein